MPPLAVTVKLPVLPFLHITSVCELIVDVNTAGSLMVTLVVVVQLFASVMVTS